MKQVVPWRKTSYSGSGEGLGGGGGNCVVAAVFEVEPDTSQAA